MNQYELYRNIIDGCDEALRDVFLRRMEMSLKVAERKLESGGAIYDPEREAAIVAHISDGLPPELALKAQSLWRSLLRMSRGRQYHFFVTHDKSLKLSYEPDIRHEAPDGPVLCSESDAPLISSTLGLEAQPCSSVAKVLEGLENGTAPWAALALEDFYDSDWLYSMIYQRLIYVNSVTRAMGGKHIFLLSRQLYDLPENDMITIAFAMPSHVSGILAQSLEVFADLKINLEYLRFKTQNINDDNKNQRSVIFADLNGQLLSVPVRAALMQLESEALSCRVIGYRRRLEEV